MGDDKKLAVLQSIGKRAADRLIVLGWIPATEDAQLCIASIIDSIVLQYEGDKKVLAKFADSQRPPEVVPA